MKDYDVVYIDKIGDKQDFVVTAIDVQAQRLQTQSSFALTVVVLFAVHPNQCLTTNVQNDV